MASAENAYRLPSAAGTTNATLVQGNDATVLGVIGYNAAAANRFLKLYDKKTAPTVGTDTPRLTICLPATTAFAIPLDDYFGSGVGFAITTGVADADTGAATAADILGLNIRYRG